MSTFAYDFELFKLFMLLVEAFKMFEPFRHLKSLFDDCHKYPLIFRIYFRFLSFTDL